MGFPWGYFTPISGVTVDGRNPATPGMVLNPCKYWEKLPYQVVQEFFHQQYGTLLITGFWAHLAGTLIPSPKRWRRIRIVKKWPD